MDNKQKKLGQVYTPKNIIQAILDEGNYKGKNILKKHVIDNSAGNGEFLIEFIERYIKVFKNENNLNIEPNKKILIKEIENYIHAIEIDEEVINIIETKLSDISEEYNLPNKFNIKKMITHSDALKVNSFDNEMDFVFGNPPYVRRRNISNLDNSLVKKYKLKGNIDLYILFFFKGLEMLKVGGTLGYITPNSFFTNTSAKELRKELSTNFSIKKIINLGHENPFKNKATTYTTITILQKPHKHIKTNNTFKYKESISDKYKNETFIKNKFHNFYFNLSNKNKKIITTDFKINIRVKNGAASCADWFFYNKNFTGEFVREAYKASTKEYTKTFFPYDNYGNTIEPEKIEIKNPAIYEQLLINKQKLINRSLQNNKWFEYARNQGIKDFLKKDVYTMAINNLTKNPADLKIELFDKPIVIFSGFYIQNISKERLLKIKEWLDSKDFFDYVKAFNKQKSGYYYTFSSSELEQFINYKIYEGGNYELW